MSTELDELRRLLAEEQRLRAEEQRLRAEEQRLRAEEQRLWVEEQRLRAEDRERTLKTSLPTFLDGLHTHLFLGLGVQQDKTKSTCGDPTVHFPSYPGRNGESIRRQLVGSELDLHHFLRQTVEDYISKIIEELYNDPTLRQNIDIRGRRRSPRLAAREQSASSNTATRDPRAPPPARSSRPRADQFCVYNIPSQSSESVHRIAAYIKEYKSPHKVKLGHIYEGLEDMDIDKVVEQEKNETLKVRFHRAIAGLLVQPYDYMIRAGAQVAASEPGLEAASNQLVAKVKVVVADILGSIPDAEVPSSEYRPPRTNGFLRMSPIQLRRKRHNLITTTNLTPTRRVAIRAFIATSNGGIHRRPIQRIRQLRKDHQQKTTGATAR
ncbi:hypothetical protein PDIDSM_5622 [Penicillium digitatum]|nr:hypothetical protein PDIDSM_5622 [Penicillium digitatum]